MTICTYSDPFVNVTLEQTEDGLYVVVSTSKLLGGGQYRDEFGHALDARAHFLECVENATEEL